MMAECVWRVVSVGMATREIFVHQGGQCDKSFLQLHFQMVIPLQGIIELETCASRVVPT